MGMKEAFETFFEEMCKKYIPSIPYREGIVSKELLLLDTLKGGYAEWRPRLQEEKISFEKIEEELGFTIHPQIKEFLNTYWFRTLEAKMEVCEKKISFTLMQLIPGTRFDELIRTRFNRSEAHYLRDNNYFLIGTYCKVDKVDSYLVQVNNETCEVTAVHVGDRRSIKLADSIEELLMTMKGIL
ncbi:MAG: SecY-interacting protein Syd [Oscillospiraceae bacterium]|nr:SecY-interacting protein Syd [Oscillospiraceae bacterium]